MHTLAKEGQATGSMVIQAMGQDKQSKRRNCEQRAAESHLKMNIQICGFVTARFRSSTHLMSVGICQVDRPAGQGVAAYIQTRKIQ